MKLSEAITKYGDRDLPDVISEFFHNTTATGALEPKHRKIDMSLCIKSGIDCSFYHDESGTGAFGMLEQVIVSPPRGNGFLMIQGDRWPECYPRMNGHIHANSNGWDKCPVPEGFVINYRAENDACFYTEESQDIEMWENIIMFEIVRIAEGWEL